MKKALLITGLVVLATAASLIFMSSRTQSPARNPSTTTEPETTPERATVESDGESGDADGVNAEAVRIAMTQDGFDPSEVTVPVGTTVTFENVDTRAHWPASDNHPQHTKYSAFDARREIGPGEKYVFSFDEAGTYGFHDHLNPASTGTVTVH